MSTLDKLKPEIEATNVLSGYNITTIPAQSLKHIIDCCNFEYDEFSYDDPTFAGALEKDDFMYINTDIDNEGRKNFTRAHELGHYFLKHKGTSFQCISNDLKILDKKHNIQEYEANKFAACLLMPRDMLTMCLQNTTITPHFIFAMAGQFEVSNTAMAIRIMEVIDKPYAVFIAKAGTITQASSSASFKYKIRKKAEPLHHQSYAYNALNNNKRRISGKVIPEAWITNPNPDNNISLKEDTFYNSKTKTALTIISIVE